MADKITFRFDDVSVNSDIKLHNEITDYLFDKFPDCEVIWAVSPCVHSSQNENGRVFPKIWNAYSDPTIHYTLDRIGTVYIRPKITVATHGLVHCDHRLMKQSAQELSIVLSANLVGAKIFVPPFNKWNIDTEYICQANGIKLIKFEDGWKSMEHEKYDPEHNLWYLHARDNWSMDTIKKWFECA